MKDRRKTAPQAAGDNGTAPHLRMRQLPGDAAHLAAGYAKHLRIAALRAPLLELLNESSTIEGLEGLGLAVWRTPNLDPLLCVYAFMDFRRQRTENGTLSPYVRISDRFEHFEEQLGEDGEHALRVLIAFQNTVNGSMDDMLCKFPVELVDQFLGPHTLGDEVTKVDLAVVQRVAVRAA